MPRNTEPYKARLLKRKSPKEMESKIKRRRKVKPSILTDEKISAAESSCSKGLQIFKFANSTSCEIDCTVLSAIQSGIYALDWDGHNCGQIVIKDGNITIELNQSAPHIKLVGHLSCGSLNINSQRSISLSLKTSHVGAIKVQAENLSIDSFLEATGDIELSAIECVSGYGTLKAKTIYAKAKKIFCTQHIFADTVTLDASKSVKLHQSVKTKKLVINSPATLQAANIYTDIISINAKQKIINSGNIFALEGEVVSQNFINRNRCLVKSNLHLNVTTYKGESSAKLSVLGFIAFAGKKFINEGKFISHGNMFCCADSLSNSGLFKIAGQFYVRVGEMDLEPHSHFILSDISTEKAVASASKVRYLQVDGKVCARQQSVCLAKSSRIDAKGFFAEGLIALEDSILSVKEAQEIHQQGRMVALGSDISAKYLNIMGSFCCTKKTNLVVSKKTWLQQNSTFKLEDSTYRSQEGDFCSDKSQIVALRAKLDARDVTMSGHCQCEDANIHASEVCSINGEFHGQRCKIYGDDKLLLGSNSSLMVLDSTVIDAGCAIFSGEIRAKGCRTDIYDWLQLCGNSVCMDFASSTLEAKKLRVQSVSSFCGGSISCDTLSIDSSYSLTLPHLTKVQNRSLWIKSGAKLTAGAQTHIASDDVLMDGTADFRNSTLVTKRIHGMGNMEFHETSVDCSDFLITTQFTQFDKSKVKVGSATLNGKYAVSNSSFEYRHVQHKGQGNITDSHLVGGFQTLDKGSTAIFDGGISESQQLLADGEMKAVHAKVHTDILYQSSGKMTFDQAALQVKEVTKTRKDSLLDIQNLSTISLGDAELGGKLQADRSRIDMHTLISEGNTEAKDSEMKVDSAAFFVAGEQKFGHSEFCTGTLHSATHTLLKDQARLQTDNTLILDKGSEMRSEDSTIVASKLFDFGDLFLSCTGYDINLLKQPFCPEAFTEQHVLKKVTAFLYKKEDQWCYYIYFPYKPHTDELKISQKEAIEKIEQLWKKVAQDATNQKVLLTDEENKFLKMVLEKDEGFHSLLPADVLSTKELQIYKLLHSDTSFIQAQEDLYVSREGSLQMKSSVCKAGNVLHTGEAKFEQSALKASENVHLALGAKMELDDAEVTSNHTITLGDANVSGKNARMQADTLENYAKIKADGVSIDVEKLKNFGQIDGGRYTHIEANHLLFNAFFGQITGSKTDIVTGLNLNLFGDIHGADDLSISSLVDLNFGGCYRSYNVNANSVLSLNAGLYIPSLPTSWDTVTRSLHDPHKWMNWARMTACTLLPGYAGVINFAHFVGSAGFDYGSSLYQRSDAHSSMYDVFCYDISSAGDRIKQVAEDPWACTKIKMKEIVPTVLKAKSLLVSATQACEGLKACRDTFIPKAKKVAPESLAVPSKPAEPTPADTTPADATRSLFTYAKKGLPHVIGAFGPTINCSSVASMNVGVIASGDVMQQSIASHNGGIDVGVRNVHSSKYMSNSGCIGGIDTSLSGKQLRNTGTVAGAVAMQLDFSAAVYNGEGGKLIGQQGGSISTAQLTNAGTMDLKQGHVKTKDFKQEHSGIAHLEKMEVETQTASLDGKTDLKQTQFIVEKDFKSSADSQIAAEHSTISAAKTVAIAGTAKFTDKSLVAAGEKLDFAKTSDTSMKDSACTAPAVQLAGKMQMDKSEIKSDGLISLDAGSTTTAANDSALLGKTIDVKGKAAFDKTTVKATGKLSLAESSDVTTTQGCVLQGTAGISLAGKGQFTETAVLSQSGNLSIANTAQLKTHKVGMEAETIEHAGKHEFTGELQLIAKEQFNTKISSDIHSGERKDGKANIFTVESKTADLQGTMKADHGVFDVEHIKDAEDFVSGRGRYKRQQFLESLSFSTKDQKLDLQSIDRDCSVSATAREIILHGDHQQADHYLQLIATEGDVETYGNIDSRNFAFCAEKGKYVNRGRVKARKQGVIETKAGVENLCKEESYQGKHDVEKKFTPASIEGGTGSDESDVGLYIKTEGKLKNDASSIGADKKVFIYAAKGVESQARYHTYVAEKRKKGNWFTGKTTTESTATAVQKSAFFSKESEVVMKTPQGKVEAIGTDFVTKGGTKMYAHDDVRLYDLKFVDKSHTSKSGFLSLASSSRKESHEQAIATVIADNGVTVIKSDEGDIIGRGLECLGNGDLFFDAKKGDIYLLSQTLQHSAHEKHSGLFVSVPAVEALQKLSAEKPEDIAKKYVPLLGRAERLANSGSVAEAAANASNAAIEAYNVAQAARQGQSLVQQSLSALTPAPVVRVGVVDTTQDSQAQSKGPGSINRRNVSMNAGRKITCDGCDIAAAQDVTIKAPIVELKGRELKQSAEGHQKTMSVDLNPLTGGVQDAHVDTQDAKMQGTQWVNQTITAGGNLHVEADKMSMDAANMTAKTASGHIGEVDIISRQDEFSSKTQSASVSGAGFFAASKAQAKEKGVTKASGIQIHEGREDAQKLTIPQANLTGAFIASDNGKGVEVKNIQTQDLHDQKKMSSSSFCGNASSLFDAAANPEKTANAAILQTVNVSSGKQDYSAKQKAAFLDGTKESVDPKTLKTVEANTQQNLTVDIPIIVLAKASQGVSTLTEKLSHAAQTILTTPTITAKQSLVDADSPPGKKQKINLSDKTSSEHAEQDQSESTEEKASPEKKRKVAVGISKRLVTPNETTAQRSTDDRLPAQTPKAPADAPIASATQRASTSTQQDKESRLDDPAGFEIPTTKCGRKTGGGEKQQLYNIDTGRYINLGNEQKALQRGGLPHSLAATIYEQQGEQVDLFKTEPLQFFGGAVCLQPRLQYTINSVCVDSGLEHDSTKKAKIWSLGGSTASYIRGNIAHGSTKINKVGDVGFSAEACSVAVSASVGVELSHDRLYAEAGAEAGAMGPSATVSGETCEFDWLGLRCKLSGDITAGVGAKLALGGGVKAAATGFRAYFKFGLFSGPGMQTNGAVEINTSPDFSQKVKERIAANPFLSNLITQYDNAKTIEERIDLLEAMEPWGGGEVLAEICSRAIPQPVISKP